MVGQYYAVILTYFYVLGQVYPYFSDSEIRNLYDSLNSNEEKIVRILAKPKLGDGPILMETFEKYNELFAQLVSVVNEDNATFEAARHICDNGGPKFLNVKIDNDVLKSKLNWTEEHMQEMYYIIGASEVLWFELKQLDPKGIHFPKIDNFTKEDVNLLYKMDKENRINDFVEFTKLDDFQRTDVPPR